MSAIILPSAYLAPVCYYAKIAESSQVQIEAWEHYIKQTYRNRCVIATENGPLLLCIPVEKGLHGAPMKDIRISDHGNWRRLHVQAMMSAYERSPYFEYYIDDIMPFYEKRYDFLLDFNEELRGTICDLIGISAPIVLTDSYCSVPVEEDYRLLMSPKNPVFSHLETPSYFQVFNERHGFLSNLSIIDLLFNMGPESILFLKRIRKECGIQV